MKVVIDIPEDRYADIQRIASVQLERPWPTPEQIIAKGVTINEPRTGKWINHIDKGMCECEVCGEMLETERAYRSNFCSNCGADMRGGTE